MPEAAECLLTTEYLKEKLENQIIVDWVFMKGQYENKSPPGFDEFEKGLPYIVEDVECKGKFIYLTLYNEDGYFFIFHSLSHDRRRWQEHQDKCCRWSVHLHNGEILWFRNPRCFATLEFTSKESQLKKVLDNLGASILTDEFSLTLWKELVKKNKNKNITSFLMNQSILSGIGNYIKAESLYYAKISPLRKTGSLKEHEIERLYQGLRIIPRIAYNRNRMNLSDSLTMTKKLRIEENMGVFFKYMVNQRLREQKLQMEELHIGIQIFKNKNKIFSYIKCIIQIF